MSAPYGPEFRQRVSDAMKRSPKVQAWAAAQRGQKRPPLPLETRASIAASRRADKQRFPATWQVWYNHYLLLHDLNRDLAADLQDAAATDAVANPENP